MQKFLPLLIVIVAGLTLAGCSLIPGNNPDVPADSSSVQQPESNTIAPVTSDGTTALSEALTATSSALLPATQVEEGSTTTFTLADIAQHNTRTDCWFAIENKVYDVSPLIASGKHPGGEAIIAGCGKDATSLFNTRPMGSGTPHSDRAREGLENFQIGLLGQ